MPFRSLVLCLLATGLAVQAADGFDARFKVRAGQQLGAEQASLSRRTFGGGFELGYAFGPHRIATELTFSFQPGTQARGDVYALPTAPDITVDDQVNIGYSWNPDWAYNHNGIQTHNRMRSAGVRLTYQHALPWKEWTLQGGLGLERTRFTHEYVGYFIGQRSADATGTFFADSWLGTPETSKLGVNPSVGVCYAVGSACDVEFNLVSRASQTINYVHVLGTEAGKGYHNSQDTLETTNRRALHMEFGVTVRF